MHAKRTKIIATIGPATSTVEMLQQLIKAGVDLIRINFSHGSTQSHIDQIERVREAAKLAECDVCILADLQGPKIRIESFDAGKVELSEGQSFVLDAAMASDAGDLNGVGVAYKALPQDVQPGNRLLLNDGAIVMDVERIEGNRVHCKVVIGGELANRKGLNIQGGGLSAGALTEKDAHDIGVAVAQGVDYIAVSFVKSGDDIRQARKLIQQHDGNIEIVAKIERTEAMANLEDIIDESDAVMVARGDLGVEMGYAELTGIQKQILRSTINTNCVCIVATQMMESMIENPLPTRAEVADVSNAILDGADAVMLSAETAVGKYPVQTVEAMAMICRGAEVHEPPPTIRPAPSSFELVDQAVAAAVAYTAIGLEAKAIVALTESGSTALWLSRSRCQIPIFAFTRHERTRRRVLLYRDVYPVPFDVTLYGIPEVYDEAFKALLSRGAVKVGDLIIFTKGDHRGVAGGTNAMKILKVIDPGAVSSEP